MPDNIPVEAQKLISQFNADQQREAAERAAKKSQISNNTEATDTPRRNITAKEILAEAARLGCEVKSGGKHIKLVGPDKRKIGVPVHGGGHGNILATGTAMSIERWLRVYQETGVATPPVPATSSVRAGTK